MITIFIILTDVNQDYLVVLFKLIYFITGVFFALDYLILISIICCDFYGVFLYLNKGDVFYGGNGIKHNFVYAPDFPADAVVLIDTCVFGVIANYFFLLWVLKKQTYVERENYKNVNMGIYLKIESFWAEKKKNPPKHSNYLKKYCCFFILNGLRFYTSIRTRYIFEQNLYLIISTFLFFAGYSVFLIIYLSPLLFLTLLFSIPQVKSYFLKVYGQDCLKSLGWDFIDKKKT